MPTRSEVAAAIAAADEGEVQRLWAQREAELAEQAARPLAFARLWHQPSPRTSQRDNTRRMMRGGYRFRFELGGNRSGKSEGGAQRDVAYALGRSHPDVQAWAVANEVPLEDVPAHPGEVWACALTSGDSKRYVRPAVERYVPAGSTWRNRYGDGEASVTLPGGGVIRFKSADQGRRAFQGSKVRRIRFDEEPDVAGVVAEAKMRIVDEDGHVEFTMTPLYGWTELLREYVQEPRPNVYVGHLHGTDNPHVPAEVLREMLDSYGEHERDARERGEIVALEGRVYTAWRRDLHVVGAFEPPAAWKRYVGVDFGTRNPTCILWGALDPGDDVLHIYREHYQAEKTQQWHARRYLDLTGDEAVVRVAADPADRGARLTWLHEGVSTMRAHKGTGSVRAQISAVAERMQPDAEGRPHLVVHDSCVHTIREVEGYVWDTRASKGDLPDAPLKRADHAMDALGYMVHLLARLGP